MKGISLVRTVITSLAATEPELVGSGNDFERAPEGHEKAREFMALMGSGPFSRKVRFRYRDAGEFTAPGDFGGLIS